MKVENTGLCPRRDSGRGFSDFSFFWSREIPVTDPRVKGPESRIFGPLSVFDCDPNFSCFCAFNLGVEEPDVRDLDPRPMQVTFDLIDGRRLMETGDTK